MALDYKSSLARYRRYVQLVAEKPLLQASLFVIFSLVLMIVLLVLALRPTLVTIAGLVGEIRQQKSLSDQLNEKILKVQEASAILSQNRQRLEVLDEAVPDRPMWLNMAEAVQSTASVSGLVVVDMEMGPIQISGSEPVTTKPKDQNAVAEESPMPVGVAGISFEMTATGDYGQIRQFLATLENLKRIVLLSEARIYKGDAGLLTVTVKGDVGYAQKRN